MFTSNNFKESNHSAAKVISVGTTVCRILNIELQHQAYDPEQFNLVFMLETRPVGGDFVGMDKDKNDLSKGKYEGRIGLYIKNGQYAFKTYEYQGKVIDRDQQIFNWITSMCKQLGVIDAMNAEGKSFDNIEDYVAFCKAHLVKPDLYAAFTIGGKEYYKEGQDRPNVRMYFPKMHNKQYPYALVDADDNVVAPDTFLVFDKAAHVIPATPVADDAPADSFTPQDSFAPKADDGLNIDVPF